MPYLAGIVTWCIALGLLENAVPIGGYILLPASGDFFHVHPGQVPRRNGLALKLQPPGPVGSHSFLLGLATVHETLELKRTLLGRRFVLGLASAHLALVAAGSADAVLIGYDKT